MLSLFQLICSCSPTNLVSFIVQTNGFTDISIWEKCIVILGNFILKFKHQVKVLIVIQMSLFFFTPERTIIVADAASPNNNTIDSQSNSYGSVTFSRPSKRIRRDVLYFQEFFVFVIASPLS